jgi:hypothetical protein
MAVSKKSLENLEKGKATQFSSINQPENNGRRQNVFSKYIKDYRISRDDIRALIESIPQYDATEVDQILKTGKKDKDGKDIVRKDVPILMTLMLKAFTADMAKGELTNTKELWDRAYGKPTQPVDIPPETLARISMTPEERRKRIEELLKKSESQPKKTGSGRSGRTPKPS